VRSVDGGADDYSTSLEPLYQLIAWCERFCFAELVWPVEDFFDLFLA
jgi:hypothetical protein